MVNMNKEAKIISAMEARRQFGDLMNRVSIGKEEYVIQRAGKPLVRMSPVPQDPFDSSFNTFDEWVDKSNKAYDEL